MAINTKKFIEQHLKIKNKDAKVISFEFNKPQQKVYDTIAEQTKQNKPIRIIILKARQMGFSTLTEGIIFKQTATKSNITSGIVAHEITATNNLFNMTKRYYENLDDELKKPLQASNAKEIIFENDDGNSTVKCMTAGNDSIGRSDTFQNLHISEYAFWKGGKENTLLGLMQAVPNKPNTIVIIESTANGYDDFKDRWDKAINGESEFIPVFCAWHELNEYQMPYDGTEITTEERKLQSLYNLSKEQIMWRRWCIRNNCGGNIDKFKQEYPACPEEAFLMSGRPVFDNQKIIDHIAKLTNHYRENPYKEGYFSFEWHNAEVRDFIKDDTIKFVEDKQRPFVRLYKEAVKGYPYVIGGDTKGEGKDFFAGTALDNTTGKRVATLHMQVSNSNPFTYQMYCLGRYYNNALISIEINFNAGPIEELQRLKYNKQYVRRKYDNFKKETEDKFGWKTDGNTRPLIIDKEIDIINNHIDLFTDITTLQEALTFVYDENNRPDALSGKHDDLLLSDMIANETRQQQSFEAEKPKKPKGHYTKEMLADWQRGNADERKVMESMWGSPY